MNSAVTHPALTARGHVLSYAEVAPRGRRLTLQLLITAIVGDALVVLLTLAASSWLRFETSLANWGADARTLHWGDYAGHILFGTVLFSFVCLHFKIYTLPMTLRVRALTVALLKAACTWMVAYISLAFLLRFAQPVSRIYVALAFVGTMGGLLVWRHLLHKIIVRAAALGRLRQRVLFVDWSPNATALAEAMISDRQHLYEIVGSVPLASDDYTLDPPARVRRLGQAGRVDDIIRNRSVDIVILANLNPPDGEMVRLANLCEKEMVEFNVIPSCFQTLVSGLHLETLRGVPVLGVSHLPLDHPINVAMKQAVDFVGAIVGLLLSAPLIAFFGFLIYRESPGPIFYKQRRVGLDGRPFWIYKLRSMRLDAEANGRVGWSTREDPRRLKIGGFIRKWNIDETPQFWNVLKGDMSLVGPRPERPELITNFKESIPHYNARHNIKPGITGWAQIHGFRGDTDLNERVRCDLFYIENWNILLDLQVLFLTFFKRTNAC